MVKRDKVKQRDLNIPAMTTRNGKGVRSIKQQREKFKQYLKNADFEEDEYEDWGEE